MKQSPLVRSVRHLGEYRLELTFEDGLQANVDFAPTVLPRQGVWAPLHDVAFFNQVRVDAELQTIVWPNGVDICPDVLYQIAVSNSQEQTTVYSDAPRA